MPQAVVPAVVAALGFTGAAATLASIALSLGGSFILGAVAKSLGGKRPDFAAFASGRQEMVRQPVVPRRTIYGRALVSGPLVYAHTFGEAEGVKNAYLSYLVALAGHTCGAIEEVWLNDRKVAFQGDGVTADTPFVSDEGAARAWIYKHLGEADQAADARLAGDAGAMWGTNHRLRGIAYLHVRLQFDRDGRLWADGIPTVRALVKGKAIYDPRTATTGWSDNPALVIHDYLTARLGIAASEIDTASVNAAANVCDEVVALKGGGSEPRYTCNGTIDDDERPIDVLQAMLSAMAGTLVRSGGRFFLHAGAATTATLALDEDDLAGPVLVQPRVGRRDLVNAVKAIYVNSGRDWQPQDAPLVTNPAYQAADNGALIVETLDLPFTTTAAAAQRIAKIELERTRQQITVETTLKLVGLQLRAWDTVTLDNARFGWSAKKFRVVGWRLNEDASIGLTLREEADAAWGWDPATDETAGDPAPDTSLPDAFVVAAPGALTFVEDLRTTRGGTVVTMLQVSFEAANDGLGERYELQVRPAAATAWTVAGGGAATSYEIGPLEDDTAYVFRARAINAIGAKSPWVTADYTIVGQTAPPADVEEFSINIVGGLAELTWEPVTDLDLSHYRLRFSSATAGVSWLGAADLRRRIARHATSVTVPARVGSYLIKAVDLRGNESLYEAVITTTVPALGGLNVIATITESPGFAGSHAGTAAPEGRLKLDSTDLFDGGAGNVDDMAGLFDGGVGAGVASAGTYVFGNTFDLGAVFHPNRVSAAIEVTLDDYTLQFDEAPGLFGAQAGLFDGSMVVDVATRLQIRTTPDDPAGAPVWSPWRTFVVGDYQARAFQFRVVLGSDNLLATPVVTALAVTIDMPDRIVEEHDLASGAGPRVVTFPGGGFRAVPAVAISAQDLASGDSTTITAKTTAGFTVTFRDSLGTAVSRTFDYAAKGYGVAG